MCWYTITNFDYDENKELLITSIGYTEDGIAVYKSIGEETVFYDTNGDEITEDVFNEKYKDNFRKQLTQ